MINIFAICKNDFFLRAIEPSMRKRGINLLGTCLSPVHLIAELTALSVKPDIILLDANWHFQNYSTESLITSILNITTLPGKIILMTSFYESAVVERLSSLRVHGYFFRSTGNAENIFTCIEHVHLGNDYTVDN